ncbi:MAG: hypothetical protein KBT20_01665 [Bacteroidales bacterium]|nr:hypothetical protein [Candidatus Liminaster caballi]
MHITTKHIQHLLVLASLVMTFALSSCGNNGCEETRETFLYTVIRPTGGLSITSVNAWGLTQKSDSLMLTLGSPKELEFILRPDSTATDIRLQMMVSDNGDMYQFDDTLHVTYHTNPYFIDMECGCSMFFTIDDVTVTNHLFKNVVLQNKEITNEERVNIVLEY